MTTGGRGGAVYEVTNLNDSGAGSLRAAVEASGARTIVFRVSGTIPLQSNLRIRNDNITIAGQTAPGDGITLANYTLQISADNVIVRFIRVRVGDQGSADGADGRDAVFCRDVEQVMIDHCSFSWSIDECASLYRNRNTTMQWCVIAESLNRSLHSKDAHGYGGIWGGQGATFHHNLLAHHASRNPRFNGNAALTGEAAVDQVDMRANVIYNWGGNSSYGGEPTSDGFLSSFNMVNNYFKPGPATSSDKADRITYPDDAPNGSLIYSRYHIAGNITEGTPETTADNWRGVDGLSDELKAGIREDEPFASPPLTQQPAEVAYAYVLQYGGAMVPKRDAIDERVLNEVATGTATYGNNGIIDSQSEVGGFPELTSLPPPDDSDHDGMPDAWELAYGLDPNNAADRNGDLDGNGYTALEDYLNSLVVHAFPARSFEALVGNGEVSLEWSNYPNDCRLEASTNGTLWQAQDGVEAGSHGAATATVESSSPRYFRVVQPFVSNHSAAVE